MTYRKKLPAEQVGQIIAGETKRRAWDWQRFDTHVTRRPSGCWKWRGPIRSSGYGSIAQGYVHRLAYERWKGQIPRGFTVDHLCRNRACVKPQHLEAVTLAENVRRRPRYPNGMARKTKCRNGHPYTVANTYYYEAKGERHCRRCNLNAHRKCTGKPPKRGAVPIGPLAESLFFRRAA